MWSKIDVVKNRCGQKQVWSKIGVVKDRCGHTCACDLACVSCVYICICVCVCTCMEASFVCFHASACLPVIMPLSLPLLVAARNESELG